jgi:lipopolysaccharide transport system permease protein
MHKPAERTDGRQGQRGERAATVIRPPGYRFDLLSQVAALGGYWDLLYTLTLHRLSVRYKQSLLGFAWALLQPLAMMIIFTVVFSFIVRVPTDGFPYPPFVYAALVPWFFFSSAVSQGGTGLVGHAQLLTKVYFPREIVPLSYIFAALIDFLVASTLLLALMLYYGIPVTPGALMVIPVILVMTLLITAFALILAATQVRFRDVGLAIPLILQFGIFASPVVYPLDAVPQRLQGLYVLNPLAGVIENFRRAVLQTGSFEWYAFAISTAFAMILLPAAYLYFKNVEATMADLL